MTNDYKDKLLKYLTGNITPGSESTEPFYEMASVFENSSVTPGFNVYEVKGALYCKNAKGELTGNILVYGNGTTNQTNWYGFIQIFDSEFNLLVTLKKYNTGTNFGIFEKLNIDEIGQVYGIDYYNNQHRLILLNNISEKGNLPNYQAILRQSYYLQGDITNTQMNITGSGTVSGILSVDKSKQSALYFMSGLDGGHDFLYACSFRINVGAENEWTEYTDGTVYTGQFLDSYVYFDEEDNISCNFYFEETDINNKHIITRTYNSGTSLTGYTTLVNNLEQYVSIIFNVSGIAINETKIYFGISGVTANGANYDNQLLVFIYDGGYITRVYEHVETLATQYYRSFIKFTMVNNKVFMIGGLANDLIGADIVGDIYVNLLDSEVDYEFKLLNKAYLDSFNSAYFCVANAFNVYNILVSFYPVVDDPEFTTHSVKIISRDGYNGEEYEGNTSLYPKQSILFDSNNTLLFARDLYNHKVYNNYAISTLNVPNNYVNGVEIGIENLIGDTNTTLVTENQGIEKNIYEDLYINFNNQIKMQNRNDTNYIDNLSGAIRLNQSCNKVLDYNNAKATKYRVTYSDNTSYITTVHSSITDGVATYEMGVHVPSDKNVIKIEILSDDESTIYQTITGLNLTNNKYYIISQDVYVE